MALQSSLIRRRGGFFRDESYGLLPLVGMNEKELHEAENKKLVDKKLVDKKLVDKRSEKIRRKRIRTVRNLVTRLLSVTVLCIITFHYLGTIRVVHDNDMYPMISDGQLIVVSKIGKRYVNEPVLYEINGEEKLGRIIAQGGDEVVITEEGLFVNGSVVYNSLPYRTTPPTKKEINIFIV